MENGGKRKRVGLSLKSFKKPALNHVKKSSFGIRLDEEPCRTGKATSAIFLSSQEKTEVPISENRMKLLNLIPRFPNWKKMASLPLNPLMKPLTETKNKVTGETTENPNKAINKGQGNTTYVDLPKLGIRYFKRRVKAELFKLNENDETCFKTAVSKPSNVEMKLTEAEHGHGLDKCNPTGLKQNAYHGNRACKQNRPEFSRNPYGKEDAVNEEYERSVLKLSDEGLAKSDQNNSSVAIVDVDSDDNISDDYSASEFNEPGSSNETNTGTLDKRLANISKEKNASLVNVQSTSLNNTTSNGHTQTIASSSKLKNDESSSKNYKFVCTKPNVGKLHASVSNTNFKNTVFHNSRKVLQNTQSNRERQSMKGGCMVYDNPRLQASQPEGDSSNLRQHNSKVNSSYSTSYTKTQATDSDGMITNEHKDVPKLNSVCNTLYHEPQVPVSMSRNSLLYSSKNTSKVLNSFSNTTGKVQEVVARKSMRIPVYENNAISALSQGMSKVNSSYNPSDNVQVSKSMEKHIYSDKGNSKSSNFYTAKWKDQSAHSKNTVPKTSKGIPKVNSLYTMSSNETHVQATRLKETPAYKNKAMSLSNSLCNTTRTNQYEQSVKKCSYASKGNTKVNSFYPTSKSEAHVQANNLKETPANESKEVSLSSILCSNTRKDQHEKSMKNSGYASKRNAKVNSLYTASNPKPQLQSNKVRPPPGYENKCISKTSSFYKKSVNQSGSVNLDDDFSTSKDTNGHLGFSDDLFGDDDELDEILANSFTDELELVQNANLGNRVDSKGFNELQLIKEDLANDYGGVEDLIGFLDDDMDADALVACCDDAMSPTIPVREKSSSRPSGSLNNPITSKGVKRRLDIPDGQSKIRRSDNSNNLCKLGSSSDLDKSFKDHDRLKECPLCAKRFHSGFSMRDIAQHIAMCCGSDEIGTDDAFW